MLIAAIVIGALGWGVAGLLYARWQRRAWPMEPPTRAVLLNHAGLPESCRTLKGEPPLTYSRPHGKDPATVYRRTGTAIVYQATGPRQPT